VLRSRLSPKIDSTVSFASISHAAPPLAPTETLSSSGRLKDSIEQFGSRALAHKRRVRLPLHLQFDSSVDSEPTAWSLSPDGFEVQTAFSFMVLRDTRVSEETSQTWFGVECVETAPASVSVLQTIRNASGRYPGRRGSKKTWPEKGVARRLGRPMALMYAILRRL
jgi:hypothetical protein